MNDTGGHEEGVPIKVVLVGQAGVGKSSLVARLVKDEFNEALQGTVGAAYMTKNIMAGNKLIKFEIWDTAGQERYHSLAPMYYRDAYIAVIVYDVTSKASFERAKQWVIELQSQMDATTEPIFALAGNKCDLNERRQVPTTDATFYASQEGLIFMETSAASGLNVHELFESIANEVSTEALSTKTPKKGHRIKGDEEKSGNGCSC